MTEFEKMPELFDKMPGKTWAEISQEMAEKEPVRTLKKQRIREINKSLNNLLIYKYIGKWQYNRLMKKLTKEMKEIDKC